MKKKILIFNDYYIPAAKCGGPVTSIRNAVDALKEDFDFYIEAANHDFGDNTPFVGIDDKWYKVGPAWVRYHKDGELDFNYEEIERFINEVNPDLMWFSGLLVPNKIHNAIRVGEKKGIPVLISPRGEASPDRMCLKGYKKYPYAFLVSVLGIYKKKTVFFHATSDDEIVGLKRFFKINENKIFKVPNIGKIPTVRDNNYVKKQGEVRAMFISRIHEVKNVDYAIKVFSQIKAKGTFDIYGPIESKEYWEKCQCLINENLPNIKIKYCGSVDPNHVSDIYKKYDCFLFPTQNENYGHVIAESLANQCPVILSKGTTPWDNINEKAGFVCQLYNDFEFVSAIERIAKMNNDEFNKFMTSTYNYYVSETNSSESVLGHKNMFNDIISEELV